MNAFFGRRIFSPSFLGDAMALVLSVFVEAGLGMGTTGMKVM